MKIIWSIAKTTVQEAVRRKVLLIILLVGAVNLVIAPALGVLATRSQLVVLQGMMLGILQLTSAAIALVLTVYMIPTEIERRTIYTILCKPVQRWQFLVGKYLGALLALGLMMGLMTLLIVGVFLISFQQDTPQLLKLLQAPMLYFVQMSLLAAVGICFSTFVSPLVNFFLSGLVYMAGTLFNPFLETVTKSQSTSPALKGFLQIFSYLIPNFANYNVQNKLINPEQTITNPTSYYFTVSAQGLVYIGVLLILGMIIFDRREI